MRFITSLWMVTILYNTSTAVDILVNQVGYELHGPKSAVIQLSSETDAVSVCTIVDGAGATVDTIAPGPVCAVPGWQGRYFQTVDFSGQTQSGTFRLAAGTVSSPSFEVGEHLLFSTTASSALAFFREMRNTDDDSRVPLFGSSAVRDVSGGWNDAIGDRGKYLSHLSFANYCNPQQTPLVIWALLEARRLCPDRFAHALDDEAAWGADYLLRVLSPGGYFYLTVFDNWGWQYPREICAWVGEDGTRTGDYQAGMREGAGMAIAALAKAAAMGIAGDSSTAGYLAGARRAWDHLETDGLAYLDDGRENIIDDYCALLAAVELFAATGEDRYRRAASRRAQSLTDRQAADGWFAADDNGARPFYHASDEGLPLVALCRYAAVVDPSDQGISTALSSALRWTLSVTRETINPFDYARLIYRPGPSASSTTDLARNRPATASQVESGYPPELAFDGIDGGGSRWASGRPYSDTEWIQVDLSDTVLVDSVRLLWEAAYGKRYAIQVSLDGSRWTDAALVTDGAEGERIITFAPLPARYVRMQGIERGIEYGFSLWSFEVYGAAPPPEQADTRTAFFMPHVNETGYWWQGENARLASIATAALTAAQHLDPSYRYGTDSLSRFATAQLDWILGSNPFSVCMLYGFGEPRWRNTAGYPSYPGKPGYALPAIQGGICNGITAAPGHEADIAWMPYHTAQRSDSLWKDWRWIEQWLPHNAWYLLSVSALSALLDKPQLAAPEGSDARRHRPRVSTTYRLGDRLRVDFGGAEAARATVTATRLDGRCIGSWVVRRGHGAVELPLRGRPAELLIVRVETNGGCDVRRVPGVGGALNSGRE